MLFDILALISTLIIIILLRRLINIFPSLLACTLRWKESVNLEASVKHSLDRDILAVAMIIPFCLTVQRFGLYSPEFMNGFNENMQIIIIIGIFTAYLLTRMTLSKLVRPRKINPKTYKTATSASFTFFIILTLFLLALGSIMTFIDIEEIVIIDAMLWVSAAIYSLFILRKMQIFISSCSIFTAFLYLCTLEIFPTGVLVASAIIF